MNSGNTGVSSFKHLLARLPPRVHSVYYRDGIGNISSSRLRTDFLKVRYVLRFIHLSLLICYWYILTIFRLSSSIYLNTFCNYCYFLQALCFFWLSIILNNWVEGRTMKQVKLFHQATKWLYIQFL